MLLFYCCHCQYRYCYSTTIILIVITDIFTTIVIVILATIATIVFLLYSCDYDEYYDNYGYYE